MTAMFNFVPELRQYESYFPHCITKPVPSALAPVTSISEKPVLEVPLIEEHASQPKSFGKTNERWHHSPVVCQLSDATGRWH